MNISDTSLRPRIRDRVLRWGFPILLAGAVLVAPDSRGAIPSPEKLLPEDTLIMVTVRDFAQMRQVWSNSPQARLWDDPAMKPFRDKLVARWNEQVVRPLKRELGANLDDFSSLLQGQLTVAVTQNGWHGSDDPSPALLVLIDTKDKKDQLKKQLAELRKKWTSMGKSIRTEKIRGVEFSIVRLSEAGMSESRKKTFPDSDGDGEADSGDAGASSGNNLVVGRYESLLVAGDSTRAVEKVMVHLTGGAMPALGDQAAYEANRLALFRDAPFYGWINVKAFVDTLGLKASPEEDGGTPNPFAMFEPSRILAALGFGGLKTLSFSYQSSSDGSFVQAFVGAPESSRQGLFKLFPAHGKESGPPSFVPADVVKFRRCRIDGQKAWATLQKVMKDISPAMSSSVNFLLDSAQMAARQKDPDFDIRKSLFGNLGDDLISYEKAPRGGRASDFNSAPSLFLISSPQPEQLAVALKYLGVLWNRQGSGAEVREFLGRKIFSVPLPGMGSLPGKTSGPAGRSLNIAASGGYVALSTDPSILEEYLRSGDSQRKTLRESPGLVSAEAKVGGTSTGWFGYENRMETTRLLINQLRKIPGGSTNTPTVALLPGAGGLSSAETSLKDWMDFSLLPPFDKISRYFYFSVYSADTAPDGLTIKWFAPTPPGLRK